MIVNINTLSIIFLLAVSQNIWAMVKYNQQSKTLEVCQNNSSCLELKIPEALNTKLSDKKTELSVDSFYQNKLFLLTKSISNFITYPCYNIYLIENNQISETEHNLLIDQSNQTHYLCQYQKISDNQLLNNYHLGPKLYQELYRYENQQYKLEYVDECLDCPFAFRTDYREYPSQKYMITKNDNPNDRKPLKGKVITDKALLLEYPTNDFENFISDNMSKMYLIKNDQFFLLDWAGKTNINYLIDYQTAQGKHIIRWIQEKDIMILNHSRNNN